MHIKVADEKVWTVCTKCGAAVRSDRGGSCKCQNVRINVDRRSGVSRIEVLDEDKAYHDNS